MKYRTFGQTGLKVSEIGIGAFPISGVQQQADGRRVGWTGTDEQQSIALIHRAEELGVNLIDSAESYGAGHSEVVVGQALQGGGINGLSPPKLAQTAAWTRTIRTCQRKRKSESLKRSKGV